MTAVAELVRVGRQSRIGAVSSRLGFGRRGRGDHVDVGQVDRLPAGHRQQQCLVGLFGSRLGGGDPFDPAGVFGSVELSDADRLLTSLRLPRAPCQACGSVSSREAVAGRLLGGALASVLLASVAAALVACTVREVVELERGA